jgi:hypothetical protein
MKIYDSTFVSGFAFVFCFNHMRHLLICDLGKTPSSTNNGLFGLFPCACLAARIRFLGGTRPIRRFYSPLDGPA